MKYENKKMLWLLRVHSIDIQTERLTEVELDVRIKQLLECRKP